MTSLEIVNEKMTQIDKGKKDFKEIKSYINHLTYEELQQIKQNLEILNKFVKYSSLCYFKNYIEEDEFYLNNFDLDSKDENRIINRINDIKILIQFIKQHEVGDSQ